MEPKQKFTSFLKCHKVLSSTWIFRLTFPFYVSSVYFYAFQFPSEMHTKSAVYSLAVSQPTNVNEVSKNVL